MLFETHNKTKKYNNRFKLRLDNVEISHVDAYKFLGLTVDQSLTWNNHINDLSKKCSSSIGILNKVKNFLQEPALLSLYNTLILSHINYGITAWNSVGVSAKNRLHIQKRALRAVSHSEFRSHSKLLFIKYNQLNIDDLCTLNIGTFMYKYCNNLLPSTFNLLFKTNSKIIAIILDMQKILIFLIINLNFSRNQFLIKVSKFGIIYLKTLKIQVI